MRMIPDFFTCTGAALVFDKSEFSVGMNIIPLAE